MDKKHRRPVPRRRVATRTLVATGCMVYAKSTKRYLFLLREDSGNFGNTWGLAGGKVESNETPIQGLIREMQEEIGDVSIPKISPLETFTSNNEKFVFHTYLGIVEEEFLPTLNAEHQGYCWVPIKKYPRPLHPGVWRSFKFDNIIKKLETIQELTDVSFLDKGV